MAKNSENTETLSELVEQMELNTTRKIDGNTVAKADFEKALSYLIETDAPMNEMKTDFSTEQGGVNFRILKNPQSGILYRLTDEHRGSKRLLSLDRE